MKFVVEWGVWHSEDDEAHRVWIRYGGPYDVVETRIDQPPSIDGRAIKDHRDRPLPPDAWMLLVDQETGDMSVHHIDELRVVSRDRDA